MKRSEMLKILIKIGDKYFHNDYEGEEIAQEMLDAVEKAGMLPPPTTIFNTDEINNPIWEPEDS